MSASSALARAAENVERMRIACKASVSNPISLLAPTTFATTYNAGQTAIHQEQLQHYRDWAYVCVNAIAKRIAGQPIYVSIGRGAPNGRKSFKDDLIPLDQHPFLDAIHTPNKLMTKWPLVFSTVASMLLTGESHWFFPTTDSGNGCDIWPIPSSWIRPENDYRDTYILRPYYNGEDTPIPAEYVAYFGLPDPSNPFKSVSPLASQAAAITADESIQVAQAVSYKNGLMPNLAIIAGDALDSQSAPDDAARPLLNTDQRNVIMDALRKMYQGASKAGSAIILDRLIKDVKKISNTPDEMAFLESANSVKERIFQAFGINPIVVGQTNDANRAQAVVAEGTFIVNVANPLIELINEVLTRWVGPLFARKGERLFVWIEPCRERDHELNIKEFELGMKYGFISRDQYLTQVRELSCSRKDLGTVWGCLFHYIWTSSSRRSRRGSVRPRRCNSTA